GMVRKRVKAGPGVGQGRVQRWLVPPWQVQTMSLVPSAVPAPLASRHLPALTSEPLAPVVQSCAVPPLQVDSWTALPSAVPVAVMHLPSARRVLPSRVHCWLEPPEQVQRTSGVPSAELPPLTSTHLPLPPVTGPPVTVPGVPTPGPTNVIESRS